MNLMRKETLSYLLCFVLAAITLVATTEAEIIIVPFAVLGAYLAFFGVPVLATMSLKTWLYVLFFLSIFLDHPSARPYYTHTPFTEVIGALFFLSLRQVANLPLPFSLFELLSIVLAIAVVHNRHHHLPSWEVNPEFKKLFYFLVLAFPATFVLACLHGLARGYDVSLMITQIRNIPILISWYLVGYYVIKDAKMYKTIFWLITIASVYKAIYSLIIFVALLGGNMGQLEYLIDHNSSMFLATSMIFLCAQFVLNKRRSVYHAVLPLLLIGIMALPYLLNDRRSSFVGVILVAGFLLFLVPRKLRYRLLIPYIAGGMLGLAVLLLKPSDGADFSSLLTGATYKGQEIVSYRSLENLNLYFAVMLHPITGLGFGTRFPIYAYMPDIAFAYELFDAIPHNSLLYIWSFAGPIGMATFSVFIATTIACCVKLMVKQVDSDILLASFMTFAVIVQWLTYVFADIGLLGVRIGFIMAACTGGVIRLYGRSIRFNNE